MAKSNLKLKDTDPRIIPQAVLATILRTRMRRAALQQQLDELDKRLDPMEETTIAALGAGYVIEAGSCAAALETSSRRCPKWKDEFVARCGEKAAEAVIEATPPSVTTKLVVSGKA